MTVSAEDIVDALRLVLDDDDWHHLRAFPPYGERYWEKAIAMTSPPWVGGPRGWGPRGRLNSAGLHNCAAVALTTARRLGVEPTPELMCAVEEEIQHG